MSFGQGLTLPILRGQHPLMNLDSLLAAALDAGGIAGAVALIGNRDGLRDAAAVGLADPAQGRAMALDTIFQLASMTKAVTSVAALQLVERGMLNLDTPIGGLLPALAEAQVLDGFDAQGAPQLRAPARPITLRHLLTHTSGLGYPFMNADMAQSYGVGGMPAPGSLASITAPLLFDPGSGWEYGVSTDWVGLAVEAASGQRLGAYFAEHILGPLGMVDTAFALTPGQTARRAALLSRRDDGGFDPLPIEIGGGDMAEFEAGGAGLLGSAPDYLRFTRMILNHGSLDGVQILRPESVAAMAQNQVAPLRAGAMGSIVPALAHPFDTFPEMHTGWGLGFLINPETGPNGRAAGSLAWAGIANSYYWIDPASDVTAVVMMQFLPFGDPGALAVLAAVERAAYR